MRIRNFSSKSVPRNLWNSLARELGLGGELPGAVADDIGLYPLDKHLRVTIGKEKKYPPRKMVETGSYTFGTIKLNPCPECTTGLLTHLLLHELFHAWLHQRDEGVYLSTDHCALAEKFADLAFESLGGRVRPRRLCGSYLLASHNAERRLDDFARTVRRFLTKAARRLRP